MRPDGYSLAAATRVLTEARRARIEVEDRRPSQREINALAKRAALEDGSYAQALDQVRELAARHAAPSARPSALEILASSPPVGKSAGL